MSTSLDDEPEAACTVRNTPHQRLPKAQDSALELPAVVAIERGPKGVGFAANASHQHVVFVGPSGRLGHGLKITPEPLDQRQTFAVRPWFGGIGHREKYKSAAEAPSMRSF
jgi:hypothetical protein